MIYSGFFICSLQTTSSDVVFKILNDASSLSILIIKYDKESK